MHCINTRRKVFGTVKAGCTIVLMLCSFGGIAQNLENIGNDKNPIAVSGGINANTVFYDASGMQGRRDPFNYFLSGNLNFSVYDWSVPLSFSYSNQNSTFQQPFNQYGLSPTYKWITLHAGYRSMNFSNYTVGGHLFLGGGFDLAPPDRAVKVSGFYGRLQKAVQEDTTRTNSIPAYQRMGGGVKVTLGGQKNSVDLIVFKAKDIRSSLETPPAVADIDPEENLVLGINFGTTIQERLILKAEYANSAITKDTRSEEVSSGRIYDKLSFAFNPRASSGYYQAIKSTLQYSFPSTGVGIAYERVDPGYRTLGAYYFNNNLESIAITSSSMLWQKKLRLNGQVGVQRNNLDNKELNTMRRLSGSLNVNTQFSSRFMTNLSYSNFQTVINFGSQFTDLNQVSPYDNLDTLNFRQISQNANMNFNYVLNESKERRQNMNMNLTYQKTSDVQADIEQPTGATFYNINGNYTINYGEKNLTLNLSGNANFTRSQQADNKIYGPSASVRKTFFDKTLSTNLTISYNNAFVNNQRTGEVMNVRMGGNFTWKEKHQFDLSLTRVNRTSPQSETQKDFSELTVQFGYNYNFSID